MAALLAHLPTRALRTLATAAALACAAGTAGVAAAAGPDSKARSSAKAVVNAGLPDAATVAGLADLGLAMLRQPGPGNAVVSPVATAAALGMVHAGADGVTEREIEALFGPRETGPRSFKLRLPALLKQVAGMPVNAAQGAAPSPFVMAGRVWIDQSVSAHVPAGYTQRMAARYNADAARVNFKDSEAVRGQINAWTAERTAGRITDLMPPGSISEATLITLSSAIHFRSAWEKPFDAEKTEARPFNTAPGTSKPVPTLHDERSVLQAQIAGTQVLALPFGGAAGSDFALLVAMPAADSTVDALLKGLSGAEMARWQAALQPKKCQLALPKFKVAPKAMALRPMLEDLGMKTAFTQAADLRPMLGRAARQVHLGDVYAAAGITIDEQGGEAVGAAAATVQSKSLAVAPPCVVDRPFVFAVLHRPTGTPLFIGRMGDPALVE